MNFFKSLIIDDPDPPESPGSESPPHHPSGSDPNPTPTPTPEPQWTFGGIIKTLQVKSDWIDTYRKDLEEFGSGLKKETQIFQQVASKAVKDIPTSIDSIGSTLLKSTAEILSLDHDDGSNGGGGSSGIGKSLNLDGKYNRFDAQLRNIQCDVNTYVMEVDDVGEFEEWKLGFDLGEKRGEIEGLMKENEVVEGIYNRVVVEDGGVVDYDVFWLRYYYRVWKLVRAENVRAKLVNRVNLVDEEEELSWDVDDDDDDDDDDDEESEANVGDKGKKVEGDVEMSDGVGFGSRNVGLEGGGKGKKVEEEVEMGDGVGFGSRNVSREGGIEGKKVEKEVKMSDGFGDGSSNVGQEGGGKGKKVEGEVEMGDGVGFGSRNVSRERGIEGKKVEKEVEMSDGFGDGSSNVGQEGGIEGNKVEKEAKMDDGFGDGLSNQTPTQHLNVSAGLGFDLSNVTQKEDDLHVKDLQAHKESGGVVSDKGSEEKGSEEVMNEEILKVEAKEVVKEGKNEASESGKDSDISVVSTQHSVEEDDMGWDEIEDLGSGDEKKGSSSGVSNREELRKRLSVANDDDDDEDLSWDIDDNDD